MPFASAEPAQVVIASIPPKIGRAPEMRGEGGGARHPIVTDIWCEVADGIGYGQRGWVTNNLVKPSKRQGYRHCGKLRNTTLIVRAGDNMLFDPRLAKCGHRITHDALRAAMVGAGDDV